MAAPLLWNPKLGDLPQLRKLAKKRREFTDEEVDWWAERVKHYLQKNAYMTCALDRATYDLNQRQNESTNTSTPPPTSQVAKADRSNAPSGVLPPRDRVRARKTAR